MIRISLLLLAVCVLLPGQGRDFFPWWDMPLVRDLNLSDDQHHQIQSLSREYRDKLIDLRAAMEKADNAVNDLMDEDRPDHQKLFAMVDRLVATRGELTKTYSQMAVRMRMVLMPQQWRELRKRRPRPNPTPGPGPQPRMQPNGDRFPRPQGRPQPLPPEREELREP